MTNDEKDGTETFEGLLESPDPALAAAARFCIDNPEGNTLEECLAEARIRGRSLAEHIRGVGEFLLESADHGCPVVGKFSFNVALDRRDERNMPKDQGRRMD